MPPHTEATKKRNAPDSFTLSAKLARRLAALDEDERVELQRSPDEIRAKFDKRRAEACSMQSDEIVAAAKAMLASSSNGASPIADGGKSEGRAR